MQRFNASSYRNAFRKGGVGYRLSILLVFVLAFISILMAISPLVRLYTMAYLGSSEAMYRLGREYYMHPSTIVFQANGYKGAFWLRKAAAKGNLHAIWNIEMGWGQSNPKEVVYWLHKGMEFKHPWCAEQLARGYRFGLYGLPTDKDKEAEFRKIAAQLRAEGKGDSDE